MLIRKRRIRSLVAYLPRAKRGDQLVFGVRLSAVPDTVIHKVGFGSPPLEGDQVLPPATLGPVSRFNADGGVVVHRDRKKETAYRMVEWHWSQWHGPHRQEQSKIVDVPYKRYPRTVIPPPSIELTVRTSSTEDLLAVAPPVPFDASNDRGMVHVVNLFLEIFGECEVLTADLKPLLGRKVRRLNWRVLPPGNRPWSQLKKEVAQVLESAAHGNRPVVEHRLERINSFLPEFVAIGQAGFRGYLIFGFPKKNLYVLESTQVDNATYLLGERWEKLSQRTKGELLAEGLHEDRVVHRANWDARVSELLR